MIKADRRKGFAWTLAGTLLAVLVLRCALSAQTQPQPAEPVHQKTNEERAQELANDKKHTFQDLLNRNPEAIANAEEYFTVVSDPKLKQRVASILLSIGVREGPYYDYLVSQAEKALNNDMPWPTLYDKEGQMVPKVINPAFLKWCKERGLDPRDTFEAAYYEIPVPWYYLAGSGDPRAYNLLITGLHSANPMIVAWSATGLAKLQNPTAIDELIAAYHRAPAETRAEIAESLLYFPDSRAQAAAEEFIADKQRLARRRQKIKEKGTKMLFGY